MARLRLCIVLALFCACSGDRRPRLVVGTTHTVEDSGLLAVLVNEYAEAYASDHRVSVIVAGSGEILAMAQRGDVDVVLSHSPEAEAALLASGRVVSREPVMRNHFVLLGPPSDPASAGSASTAAAAFRQVAAARQPFVSRGDDSGTHRMELAVWSRARVEPAWDGYIEAGTGMADALRLASERGGYILSDVATYEAMRGELDLGIVHERSNELPNEYSVLIVADARNPDGARTFADWLMNERARELIAGYRTPGSGRALFIPAARRERQHD
ncbi:MAG TPA: substrate-binding domain-containing protein [Longimicrobiales bacterium]|nr:substrate-binding domain-containing protein [Longimicrobiales bacterium]